MATVTVNNDYESDNRPGEDPCPVIDLIRQIGSEWRLIVLYDLLDEEKRFSEIERSTGARPRTLSRVLSDLEDMGFVARRLEEASPVATYYSLTEKGTSLCPVFAEMESWTAERADSSQSAATSTPRD